WDAPELLDVDVDELAGTVTFVADRGGLRGADHLAGQRVAVVQSGHSVAAQDPGDRSCRHADVGGELVGSTAAFTTRCEHPFLDIGCGLVRERVRPRRAVLEAIGTGVVEAVDPTVGTL